MSTLEIIVTIAGLVLITLGTRGFFILPDRELPMPEWLREGLRSPARGRVQRRQRLPAAPRPARGGGG